MATGEEVLDSLCGTSCKGLRTLYSSSSPVCFALAQ